MTQKKWYYRQHGTEIGPLSSDELKRLATDGKIEASAEVRGEGGQHWVSVSKVKEIAPFCTGVEIVANEKDGRAYPPPPPLPSEPSNPRVDAPPPPIPRKVTPTVHVAESPNDSVKEKVGTTKKEKWIRIGGNDEPSKIGNFIKYVVSGLVAGLLLFNKSQLRNKDKNFDIFGPKSVHSTESSYQKRVLDHQKAVERLKNFPAPSSSK